MNDFSLIKNTKNKLCFIKGYLNRIFTISKLKKFKLSKSYNQIEIKDIYEESKNQINNKQKIIKKRNAGVDLIRIVSMLGIVYVHVLSKGNVTYKYNRYKSKINSSISYVFWHNNAFSLISDVISNKSTKYSNLLYLWLCVVFYSVCIRYYYLKYKKVERVIGRLYQEFSPVIHGRYWYVSSYFGMFIFLPVINKGIPYLNKSEFKLLVMSIVGIFIIWNNYFFNKKDYFIMNRGYSPICLLYLYIIGAYIKNFNKEYSGTKRYIISLIYFFIFISLGYIYNQYSDYKISDFSRNYKTKLRNFIKRLLSNNLNGTIRTTQAILITSFFLQLKYNEFISKFITFFGQLTFGVYLIHNNDNVANYYIRKIFNGQPDNLTSKEVIQLLILKSIKIFIECIIIEYLRNLLFNILKIRNICLFIEKVVFKIVS